MRVEFKQHPKYGFLEGQIDGETVYVEKMELIKEARILIITFCSTKNGKREEVVFRQMRGEERYALEA
jgi:hypothetical protein